LGCFFDLFSMRLFCFHDLGHKFVVLTWIDSDLFYIFFK